MERGILDEIRRLLRPLSTRLANVVVRGEVHLVADGDGRQTLQVEDLETGAVIEGAQHFQAYGFSSVPLAGASVIAVCDGGDHERAYVVAVSDARHRPKGGEPGEVTVYNHTGAKIRITKDGDIAVTPAPGREVLVSDGSGTPEPLVKRSEFLAHGHPTAGTGPPSPPTPVPPAPTPPPDFPGTEVLKST